MTNKEIYKIWAPEGIKWTAWVRPVPFIEINKSLEINEFYNLSIPKINYLPNIYKNTAIIVDLPNYNSIKEGLALARLGYRPIPIFNGTNEQYGVMATTNNHNIELALVWGALKLKEFTLTNDAPPAFLIDTDRMNRYKMNASIFDNSWDIYHQDLPSAQFFLKNGISKIIIRSENNIQKDLSKILFNYQKNGLEILFTNGYSEPKKIKVKKPLHKEL